MKIAFVNIQNFRKLRDVYIDFSDKETIFVGANNSGKTTAVHALNKFLNFHKIYDDKQDGEKQKKFIVEDFTLSLWKEIETIATKWEIAAQKDKAPTNLQDWEKYLPSLDVWLDVNNNEYHHVYNLIPTLGWTGGLLGIRLRLQPKNIENLYKDYRSFRQIAKDNMNKVRVEYEQGRQEDAEGSKQPQELPEHIQKSFWPRNMHDFLSKNLMEYFEVCYFELNPSKVDAKHKPQELSDIVTPKKGNPFAGIIRIDTIGAQRQLDDAGSASRQKLSTQFFEYFKKHLNPEEKIYLEENDINAILAICGSEKIFDENLEKSFEQPLKELEQLNYPNVTSPKIRVQTTLQTKTALEHSASVQYCVNTNPSCNANFLPESFNGLGYQNLISLVFKLMSFRDGWMRVNREKQKNFDEKKLIPEPIHLVLIEEPEAHLHVQVQQVFIREAYKRLRDHPDLAHDSMFTTQLIISTHSSNIAHECDFSQLRYFQRLLSEDDSSIPESCVKNLATVFAEKKTESGREAEQEDDSDALAIAATNRFVTRYLKATHCDLFFADAIILYEGAGERMLFPQFLKKFEDGVLNRCYITQLEIGGSHAFRLIDLITFLELPTLIVTDIDSVAIDTSEGATKKYKKSCPVRKNEGQSTANTTLKNNFWKNIFIDELLNLSSVEKEIIKQSSKAVIRVAFQYGIDVEYNGDNSTVYPRTFEDALVASNLEIFENISLENNEVEQIKKINEKLLNCNVKDLGSTLYEVINSSSFNKSEFALEVLFCLEDTLELNIPNYIDEGLHWLKSKIIIDAPCVLSDSLLSKEVQ